jgi:hypothetical protein
MRSRPPRITVCFAALVLSGCGGKEPAKVTDVDLGAPDVQYFRGVVQMVQQVRESAAEGVPGLASSIDGVVEGLEPMEANLPEEGEHRETCQKIFQGVRDLQTMAKASAPPAEVKAKLDELQQLAAQLPDTALSTTTPSAGK